MTTILTREEYFLYKSLIEKYVERFGDEITEEQEKLYYDSRHTPTLEYYFALANYIAKNMGYPINMLKLILAHVKLFELIEL